MIKSYNERNIVARIEVILNRDGVSLVRLRWARKDGAKWKSYVGDLLTTDVGIACQDVWNAARRHSVIPDMGTEVDE